MPRVIITGPDFIGTCEGVAAAFVGLGWDVDVHTWSDLARGTRDVLRARFRAHSAGGLTRRVNFEGILRERVVASASESPPDLILAVKPHRPTEQLLGRLTVLGVPLVVWATDSLERYPGQTALLEVANHGFVMDGGDVQGGNVSWLPLGFEDRIFSPALDDSSRPFDVLFVGNIFQARYLLRGRYFDLLRRSAMPSKYRVAFVGSLPSPWLNRLKWFPGRIEWLGPHLPLPALARAVASSRICVNIHQDDGSRPVNPMFFAIPACGSCQVTDDRAYLGNWLREGTDYFPARADDFLAVLEWLLSDGRARAHIAREGRRAAAGHSYQARTSHIVEMCRRQGFVRASEQTGRYR